MTCPDLPMIPSSRAIRRHPSNPVLSAEDIPYGATLIFNAGVVKYEGQYVMVFRNDHCAKPEKVGKAGARFRTSIGIARSADGVAWEVENRVCLEMKDTEIRRVYDPRLSVIDGRVYMCFAQDTEHGIRGGIATTEDFHAWSVLCLSVPDNRNMVLFPERIGGRYVRLERPFPIYSRGGRNRFDIWSGCSPDLRYWGDHELVLGVEDVPYANDKIGPAAPPVRTEAGWLTTFHAVDRDESRGKNGWENAWKKRYTAGIMLLDLDEPHKVVGMSKHPLIAPEAPYETDGGFRNDVIFPGGMILEEDGEVKIYYGSADTVECLATADVGDLISLCTEPRLAR